MEQQSKINEITSSELDTQTIIIYGKQGAGKTLLSIILAMNRHKRIYSNFDIIENGKAINKKITTFEGYKNIGFSRIPGVIIIDEAGINMNSKDGMSGSSRIIQDLLFIVRKKNCNLIFIAQRLGSIDINVRLLCDLLLKCHKIRRLETYPTFEVVVEKQTINNLVTIPVDYFEFDFIKILELSGITYNTLDQARLTTKENVKETKKEVE